MGCDLTMMQKVQHQVSISQEIPWSLVSRQVISLPVARRLWIVWGESLLVKSSLSFNLQTGEDLVSRRARGNYLAD